MMAAEGNAADSANASMSSAAVAVENIPVLADVIPADRYDPNDESMRSCRRYLSSLIKGDGETKQKLMNAINDKVIIVSRLANRGSIVTMLHVNDLYQNGKGATFEFKSTTFRRFFNPSDLSKVLPASYHDLFEDTNFPQKNDIKDCSVDIDYLYQDYMVRYKQHLRTNFFRFQNHTIKTFCNVNGLKYTLTNSVVKYIQKMIRYQDNEDEDDEDAIGELTVIVPNEPMRQKINDFIVFHRRFWRKRNVEPSANNSIDDDWISNNFGSVALYFAHLLNYQDQNQHRYKYAKPFHIAPFHKLKRHSISIDRKNLFVILKHSGLVDVGRNQFMKDNAKQKQLIDDVFSPRHFQ